MSTSTASDSEKNATKKIASRKHYLWTLKRWITKISLPSDESLWHRKSVKHTSNYPNDYRYHFPVFSFQSTSYYPRLQQRVQAYLFIIDIQISELAQRLIFLTALTLSSNAQWSREKQIRCSQSDVMIQSEWQDFNYLISSDTPSFSEYTRYSLLGFFVQSRH